MASGISPLGRDLAQRIFYARVGAYDSLYVLLDIFLPLQRSQTKAWWAWLSLRREKVRSRIPPYQPAVHAPWIALVSPFSWSTPPFQAVFAPCTISHLFTFRSLPPFHSIGKKCNEYNILQISFLTVFKRISLPDVVDRIFIFPMHRTSAFERNDGYE